MKNILYILCIISVLVAGVQAERSVSGFNSYSDFRQLGEYRLWTFISKDSVIGTLVSTVKERIDINGTSGFSVEQKLQLDYSKAGTNLKFDIFNQHFIANNGMYLGDKMKLTINDITEEINVKRDGSSLNGYITRNNAEIDQSIDLGEINFAIENNYVDQLEMFLASLEITVGTQINDTIFMSQSLIETDIVGLVEDFKNVQLYNKVFDSVFIIEFTYPTMMTAYFTPDKRLVKLVVPSRELKIYQDAIGNPLKAKIAALKAAQKNKSKPVQLGRSSSSRSISKLIIVFLLYTVIGVVISFFFIKNKYKQTITYIALLAGGITYIFIPFTQIPLQELLFKEYFIPNVLEANGSPLIWGVLPAFTAGLIQSILVCLVIVFVCKFLAKKNQYVSLGAVIGLGFGLVEATFLAYGTPASFLFGINLVERVFLILFHISAGTLLGYAFKQGLNKVAMFMLMPILINSIFRYLPIFAQNKTLTPELLGILFAFISILFLTLTVFITKKDS